MLILFSSYLGIFRTLVDRIRSGLSASPTKTDQISKLITTSLTLPNHERPFHVEASFLSSTQIITGSSLAILFLLNLLGQYDFASYLLPCGFRHRSFGGKIIRMALPPQHSPV